MEITLVANKNIFDNNYLCLFSSEEIGRYNLLFK